MQINHIVPISLAEAQVAERDKLAEETRLTYLTGGIIETDYLIDEFGFENPNHILRLLQSAAKLGVWQEATDRVKGLCESSRDIIHNSGEN